MAELPGIYAPIECAHCFGGLDSGDGDGWTCSPCGLHWPDANPYAEVEPVFLDEDAEPCGESSKDAESARSGYRFWYSPCNLPEGHDSKHHWPLECERLTPEPDGYVIPPETP